MDNISEFRAKLAFELEEASKFPTYSMNDKGELQRNTPEGVVYALNKDTADISDVVFKLFNEFIKQEIPKHPRFAGFLVAMSTVNSDTNEPEIITFAGGNRESIEIIIESLQNPLYE